MFELTSPVSLAGPALVGTSVALLAACVAALLLLLLALFGRAPFHARWVVLVAGTLLFLAIDETTSIGQRRTLTIILGMVVATALAGGAVAVLLARGWRNGNRLERAKTAIALVAGTAMLAAGAAFLFWDGPPRAELATDNAVDAAKHFAPRDVPDPAARGTYQVASLTYGSGTDLHRPEFGEQATLRTEPVDASGVLRGWKGLAGWARTAFFGFDDERLPLNGRVWYPEGDGPFPLVLVVHGNHGAARFSDPGYQYLGEHLASHGYIVVSVDENFLNFKETDVWWGLESENNARGWVLLEHLRVWHTWNADAESPFHQRVDTERIALIGHSRGGEAAAHAAAFNRLPVNPDDGTVAFDYGYDIKSVVAIAPSDGQYQPTGRRTPLTDVNYLTIQGSHDSDVASFSGLYQYDRVSFSGDVPAFKSAVYVYGANHGQFNTTWGQHDIGSGMTNHFLNTAALLPEDQQRQIALVYITAFLDCTLRDRREYQPLFQDAAYGAGWLPETVYLTAYADSTMQILCEFDEDIDLSTGSLPGTRIETANLTDWREKRFGLRSGRGDGRAVWIGWDHERQPEASYTVRWPADAVRLSDASLLAFDLAEAGQKPTRRDPDDNDPSSPAAEQEPDPDLADKQTIDLSIEVIDSDGDAARLPLGHVATLRPQIKTPFYKSTWLHARRLSQPVPRTFLFPLADFQAVNEAFDPSKMTSLRLLFDRTPRGVVILDNVALGTADTGR